jgi:hypothetical protein
VYVFNPELEGEKVEVVEGENDNVVEYDLPFKSKKRRFV